MQHQEPSLVLLFRLCLNTRYWNDKDVLQKLGEAMGLPVTGDAATAIAGNSGAGEAEEEEEVNEDESIVHQTASTGDVEVQKRFFYYYFEIIILISSKLLLPTVTF